MVDGSILGGEGGELFWKSSGVEGSCLINVGDGL